MAFVKVFACTALDNNARIIRSQGRSEARQNVSPAKDQQREFCLLIPKVHITTSPRSHFEKPGAVSFYLVPTMYNTVCVGKQGERVRLEEARGTLDLEQGRRELMKDKSMRTREEWERTHNLPFHLFYLNLFKLFLLV